MSISPNPSHGSVTIESGSTNANTRIEIYDILGNQVAAHLGSTWLWNGERFDGTSVPNGIYIIRLSTGRSAGRSVSQRILMQR